MNKKGQALVEFIMILPVIILLFFGGVDFGRIIIKKNELENVSSDIIDMYKNNEDIEKINELLKKNDKDGKVSINVDEAYTNITLTSKVKIITPGLNNIIGKDYEVSVKRVISNE